MTYPPNNAYPGGMAADGSDPYRYGPPAPQGGPSAPTGRQILSSSWAMLKRDRSLIVLPVLGTFFGAVAYLAFFVPGLILQIGGHHNHYFVYPFVIVGGFFASVIGIFFQAALIAGAYQRADGGDPTVGSCLEVAWRMKTQVLGWAVFTSSVGAVVRLVEQRLGIFGRLLGFLGGVAWAVATFFAVPAIVAEGLGPIEALKRSAHTIRQTWGTSVRTTLRFGLLGFVLTIVPIAVTIVGVVVLVASANSTNAGGIAAGGLIAVVGFLAIVGLGAVLGAVGTYARAMIYRWTTGRPVPGIDPALFAGAFAARRGRGRGRRG
jgi:hypothetical protein